MSDHIQSACVVVTCPSCGAEDYDIDFDGQDIADGVHVRVECDECPHDIDVHIDVMVQSVKAVTS